MRANFSKAKSMGGACGQALMIFCTMASIRMTGDTVRDRCREKETNGCMHMCVDSGHVHLHTFVCFVPKGHDPSWGVMMLVGRCAFITMLIVGYMFVFVTDVSTPVLVPAPRALASSAR